MPLGRGARVGRYEIMDPIGRGGMGEVYRARDTRLGREVAIKILPPDMASHPGRLRRFHSEARAASALNHPNIVTIHETGTHAGVPFIVMEYVAGETLRQALARGALSQADVLRLGAQLVEGVAKAHAAAIVHRDLKPENIVISDDGYVKILDFGLAKLLPTALLDAAGTGAETLSHPGTSAGAILGTVSYMSPEQAKGLSLDHRSDQFSLGAILYEMSTGKRAFGRGTAAQTLAAILNEEPRLEGPLGAVVERCLKKDAEKRWNTTLELLDALRSLAGSAGTTRATAARSQVGDSRAVVAVLPLASLSASTDDAYFSDGMTEDIIAQLSQVASLRVISRTSVMRYKRASDGLKTIAAALGATHVVEGSIRRSGDRLRIVAQLIEVSSDSHLWAETFDRELTDVFAIQSEVAQRVGAALRAHLTPEERRRVARRPTDDLEAYDLYLRARHQANLVTADGLAGAVDLYERAVARDPDFAKAWAGLSTAYHFHLAGYYEIRPRLAAAKTVEYASKALVLDPDVAEAHLMLGLVADCLNYDYHAGGAHFRRALELGPSLAEVHLGHGNHLVSTGCLGDALAEAQIALQLDPGSEYVHIHAAFLHYVCRRFHEGLRILDAAAALFGRKVVPLTQAETMIAMGRQQEAVEVLRELCARLPIPWNQGHLAWALAAAGEAKECREWLARLHERESREWVWPLALALTYGHLGEMDRAFLYLERCYEERVSWLQFTYAPTFDLFRSDPRFKAIAEKIGCTPPPDPSEGTAR